MDLVLPRTINHGLALLYRHRFEESASTLRQALQIIARSVENGNAAIPTGYASIYFESVSIEDKLPNMEKHFSIDHNTFHLHQEVFVFRRHQEPEETNTCSLTKIASYQDPRAMDLHVRSLSAALLFNLAFVNHLQGLYDRNSRDLFASTTKFDKAANLYDMAMASLQETSNAPSTPYLMLAILNNQAHLSMQIWDFPALDRNIRAIQFILSQVDQEDPFLEPIHMNVVCATRINSRSAPAA